MTHKIGMCTPPLPVSAEPWPNFQTKGGGGLDRISVFRAELLGMRGK